VQPEACRADLDFGQIGGLRAGKSLGTIDGHSQFESIAQADNNARIAPIVPGRYGVRLSLQARPHALRGLANISDS
jgi:hypothetical protein